VVFFKNIFAKNRLVYCASISASVGIGVRANTVYSSCVWFMYASGDDVLAEWKDERYYAASVVSVADHGIDVKFTDDSTMSVQQQSVVKCSRIPIGCTVLARTDESAWYEPAVIKSYYTDVRSQLQGYVVLFTGHTSDMR